MIVPQNIQGYYKRRVVVACHYSPPGNVVGKFNENVLAPRGEPTFIVNVKTFARFTVQCTYVECMIVLCEKCCTVPCVLNERKQMEFFGFPAFEYFLGPVRIPSLDKCHLGENGKISFYPIIFH